MIELPILESLKGDGDTKRGPSRAKKQRHWRSLGELGSDPELAEFVRHEFLPEAAGAPDETSRRQFLQLMGASVALAGLTGCRKPYEKILPYSRKPEQIIEGISMHYATAMPFRGSLSALLVESHEGRPTKVEGNPEHPVSRGSSGVFEQASILDLYDPDRSTDVLHDGGSSSWEQFSAAVSSLATSSRIGVLIAEHSSPTIAAQRDRIAARFPNLMWASYSPFGENTEVEGYRLAFGQQLRPLYRFSRARVVVSLDADFLAATDRNFVHNTREFSQGRAVEDRDPLRLYVVEPAYSTTGGMADHRARVRPSELGLVAAALASRLGVQGVPTATIADESVRRLVDAIAADLRSSGSEGVVVAGEGQPPEVHAVCAAINHALGSFGTTVEALDISSLDAVRDADVETVFSAVKSGTLDALFLIGVNPAYDRAGDEDLIAALSNQRMSVHVGMHVDETAALATWHVPAAHYLEAWGDGRAYDGTLSVIQPLIAPLYPDARSAVELLAVLAGGTPTTGYDEVLRTWQGLMPGPMAEGWRRVLHDGLLPDSGFSTVAPARAGSIAAGALQRQGPESGFEVQVRPDTRLLDGSFANNAWLQETPDLVNKIVWDNVAVMSRATADELGVQIRLKAGKYYTDQLTVTADGRSVTLPAWISPGVADRTVILTTGSGRNIRSNREHRRRIFFDTDASTDIYGKGAVATGVGVNVAALRGAGFNSIISGATATREADRYLVVTTQDHGALDTPELLEEIETREPVRLATLTSYRDHTAHFAHDPLPGADEAWEDYPALWEARHPSTQDFFKDNPYYENQWGMVIDLNTCTGCNACAVACQAENNVQVVGKREVGRGREMSWIRIDRYFVTEGRDVDEARMVVQPMPCQHCENAPCEAVCPVAATVHSPDGTNQMIYNRCIGTRYCANNCPYKVRRFNYFNWTKNLPVTVQMAQNPDVTVRFRGVMEKCSYCIQRIRAKNQQANLEDRAIQDGEVLTACQQACPANAIVFGNLNDPQSAVSKKRSSDRRYEVLAELSVKPRTSYLGRIHNPNPSIEANA